MCVSFAQVLNQNDISDLSGLSVFTDLEVVSLSSNSVSDLDQLRHLSHLKGTLEELSFDGNPVCDHPNYRSCLIASFPYLRSFPFTQARSTADRIPTCPH